jgi:hypothetical protein
VLAMTTPSDPDYGNGESHASGSGHGDGQQPLIPPPVQHNQQQAPQDAAPLELVSQGAQQAPQAAAPWGEASQGGQQFAAPGQPDGAPGHQAPQWGQAAGQFPLQPYPQTAYYPVVRKPKRRVALVVRLSILGVVLAIALISFLVKHFSAAQVDANGNVTKAGNLSVFSLKTGQCFDEPSTSTAVSSITAIPCDQAHDAQVTGNISLTESSYDQSALDSDASNQCQTIADGTVDGTKIGADAGVLYFVPNQDDWNTGDHSATCAIDENGTKITGTVLK